MKGKKKKKKVGRNLEIYKRASAYIDIVIMQLKNYFFSLTSVSFACSHEVKINYINSPHKKVHKGIWSRYKDAKRPKQDKGIHKK